MSVGLDRKRLETPLIQVPGAAGFVVSMPTLRMILTSMNTSRSLENTLQTSCPDETRNCQMHGWSADNSFRSIEIAIHAQRMYWEVSCIQSLDSPANDYYNPRGIASLLPLQNRQRHMICNRAWISVIVACAIYSPSRLNSHRPSRFGRGCRVSVTMQILAAARLRARHLAVAFPRPQLAAKSTALIRAGSVP